MKRITLLLFCFLASVFSNAQAPAFNWAKQLSANGTNYEKATFDAMGNIYITGYFSGIVDFDLGPNTYTVNSGFNGSNFITKYDSNGGLIWEKSIGGGGLIYDIDADGAGNV